MIRRFARVLFCAFAFAGSLSAVGCMKQHHTSGSPIAQDKVDRIVDGQTTTDQVLVMFGAPQSQTTLGDRVLYVYRYTVTEGETAFLPYYTTGKSSDKYDELTIEHSE